MYKLEYLPTARQDIIDITLYIGQKLDNPAAAERLASDLIDAAEKMSEMPYAYPNYWPNRPLNHEYRKLLVRNYLILYWVNEERKIVTVARVVYARSDYGRKLE